MKYPSHQPDYIFETVLDDEDMNSRICQRITDVGDEVHRLSNIKADMMFVRTLKFDRPFPEFRKLISHVEDFSRAASREMNLDHEYHSDRLSSDEWRHEYIDSQHVNAMWGSRGLSNEITLRHNHWPAIWAFVYYIDPPEGSSNLVFTDMNKEIKPENGKLILFGGHVMHETVPKEFEGERFMVAGTVVSNPPETLSLLYSQ